MQMRKFLGGFLGLLLASHAFATSLTPVSTLFLKNYLTTATPTFSPSSGAPPQTVTVSDSTGGAFLYCTFDGSTPTIASPACPTTISITTSTTVKAVAQASGFAVSQVGSATFTSGGCTFGVVVVGNHLASCVDGSSLQLRGANVGGALEGIPFSPDPWRTEQPNAAAMASWGMSVVRLPISEANWLGLCSATLSQGVTPAVFQAAIQTAVTSFHAQGMYVILDLHWIAVPNLCPSNQPNMADAQYSPTFWNQVAAAYKNDPAVMFELINEPVAGNTPATTAEWNNYVNGGLTGPQDTGTQALLNAIRTAGAHNVVIVDCLDFASTCAEADGSGGPLLPTDTLSTPQIAVAMHYYWGTQYENSGNVALARGLPIMVTEWWDNSNKTDASSTNELFGWADPGGRAAQYLTAHGQDGAHFPGISYVAWTWDWGVSWYGGQGYNNGALIQDSAGDEFTPSAFPALGDSSTTPIAYASTVKNHYLCRKSGAC